MRDYWVVYTFNKSKSDASKNLTSIKKKFPSAEIEKDKDIFVVSLGHYESKEQALKIIHKAISLGYWGGIYSNS